MDRLEDMGQRLDALEAAQEKRMAAQKPKPKPEPAPEPKAPSLQEQMAQLYSGRKGLLLGEGPYRISEIPKQLHGIQPSNIIGQTKSDDDVRLDAQRQNIVEQIMRQK